MIQTSELATCQAKLTFSLVDKAARCCAEVGCSNPGGGEKSQVFCAGFFAKSLSYLSVFFQKEQKSGLSWFRTCYPTEIV